MRIAKYISNAGICSRREAERLIENQQVKINDQLCIHPSILVKEKDEIKVNGKLIKIFNLCVFGNYTNQLNIFVQITILKKEKQYSI